MYHTQCELGFTGLLFVGPRWNVTLLRHVGSE